MMSRQPLLRAHVVALALAMRYREGDNGRAGVSIEGRSGGSHDVTPLLDGDAGDVIVIKRGDGTVADPDEVAHGAT